jgi:putative hydroxymethylpyrimidine transport system substrate-binding protein
MAMTRRWFAALCVVLLLGVLAAPLAQARTVGGRAQALRSTTLLLDWYPNSDHAGIFAALAAGDYARRGLDLKTVVPSDVASVLEEVAQGHAEFGISYNTDTLLAQAHGLPVVAIAAIMQHPLNTIITLKSSGITRPRQLMGKTVGIYGLPSDYADLHTVVAADGGDPAKVHTVTVSYDLVQGLEGKKVDAIIGVYWSWEGLLLRQQGFAINELRLNQWGVPDYYELVIVTGRAFAAAHPEVVRAFLAATSEGYRAAMAHPAAAASDLIRLNPKAGLSKQQAVIAQSVELLAPTMRDPRGSWGWESPARWQAYATWMAAHQVLKAPLNTRSLMTNAYLPS